MKLLLIYLLLVNAAAFLLMLIDKQKAIHKRWRIPEKTLLLTAAAGGSVGAILGMKLFRHKTLHPQFSVGLPVMLALQVIGAVILCNI